MTLDQILARPPITEADVLRYLIDIGFGAIAYTACHYGPGDRQARLASMTAEDLLMFSELERTTEEFGRTQGRDPQAFREEWFDAKVGLVQQLMWDRDVWLPLVTLTPADCAAYLAGHGDMVAAAILVAMKKEWNLEYCAIEVLRAMDPVVARDIAVHLFVTIPVSGWYGDHLGTIRQDLAERRRAVEAAAQASPATP